MVVGVIAGGGRVVFCSLGCPLAFSVELCSVSSAFIALNLELFHRGLDVKKQNGCGLTSIYFGETPVRNWAHQSLQDKISFVFISDLRINHPIESAIVYVYELPSWKDTIALYNIYLAAISHYYLSCPSTLLLVILCRTIFFKF